MKSALVSKVFNLSARQQLALILTLTGIAFLPSLSNGFVWDDSVFILNWPQTNDLFGNLTEFLQGAVPVGHEGVYRPLRSIYYSLANIFYGQNPLFYHLQAVLFHLLSTFIVFKITHKISKQPNIAFLSSLLFGIHPVHTEAVAWATASFDTIGVTIALISFYFYLQARHSPTTHHPISPSKSIINLLNQHYSSKYYLLSVTTAAIAFLSSEITLSLPFLILLYELVLHKSKLRSVFSTLLPYGFLFLSFFAIRFTLLGTSSRIDYPYQSFYLTMLAMTKVIVLYWQQLVVPLYLSPYHQLLPGLNAIPYHDFNPDLIKYTPSLVDPIIISSIAFIIITLLTAYKFRQTHPMITFAILWVFLSLLPVMQFFPQPGIFSERHLYTASLGFCLGLGYLINYLLTHPRITTAVKNLLTTITFTIIITWTYLTFTYTQVWSSDFTLWSHAQIHNPQSALIQTNLGEAYYQAGDIKTAHQLFLSALDLNPHSSSRHFNLGLTYLIQEDFQKAQHHFSSALEYKPDDYQAKLHLGVTHYKQQHYQQALEEILFVIKQQPNNDQAYINLAAVYMATGDLDLAREALNTALEINPSNPLAPKNLELIDQSQNNQ